MLQPIGRVPPASTLGNSLTDGLQYDALVKLSEAGGQKIVWGRTMIPCAADLLFLEPARSGL